jgi:hypothetical protein
LDGLQWTSNKRKTSPGHAQAFFFFFFIRGSRLAGGAYDTEIEKVTWGGGSSYTAATR